jgi:hypothetical protein
MAYRDDGLNVLAPMCGKRCDQPLANSRGIKPPDPTFTNNTIRAHTPVEHLAIFRPECHLAQRLADVDDNIGPGAQHALHKSN